eukprot:m.426776 g.426776  ORF g.426776 m.426776 type:complete len:392 (+) comp21358_c0_seq5:102-1277(+)
MVDPKVVKKAFKYVKNGDVEEVEEMLGDGSLSPNEQDKGRDILSVAVENAHAEIVEILLKKGANPDSTSKKGKSSLAVAYENDMPDIFELLLSHGTDPNVAYEKATLLAATLSDDATEYTNMLLTPASKKQKRIDPNHAGKDGYSNFHHAIMTGHGDLVLSFLESPYNADVDIASKGGAYPAHIAASRGLTDVLKAIVARDGNSLKQPHRDSADSVLMVAVDAGQMAVVDMCLASNVDVNHCNKDGATALHFAVYNDDRVMVEKILEGGAEVNALTKDGHAPLDYIPAALHDVPGGTAEVAGCCATWHVFVIRVGAGSAGPCATWHWLAGTQGSISAHAFLQCMQADNPAARAVVLCRHLRTRSVIRLFNAGLDCSGGENGETGVVCTRCG